MKTHFANLLAFSLCCSILPRVVWVAHSYIHPPEELGNNEGLFNLFPSPQQCSSFTFLDISQPFLTSSSHGQMITNMWMDEEERARPMVDCWKRADLGHISSDENVTLVLEKRKKFSTVDHFSSSLCLMTSFEDIRGHPSSALVISCKIAPMTLLLFKRCNFRKQSQSWGERVNAFFYQVAASTNLRFLSSNVRNHFYYYHDVNHKGKLLLLSKVLFWPRPLLE